MKKQNKEPIGETPYIPIKKNNKIIGWETYGMKKTTYDKLSLMKEFYDIKTLIKINIQNNIDIREYYLTIDNNNYQTRCIKSVIKDYHKKYDKRRLLKTIIYKTKKDKPLIIKYNGYYHFIEPL